MEKKILLLTTIYPSPDLELLNGTNICHYFTKEWKQAGHDVRVVFNYPVYSSLVHSVADFFGKRVASLGQSYFITKKINEIKEYQMDDVSILRAPLYKVFPKVAVHKKTMKKQIDLICNYLDNNQFKPDIVVAHFCYPHLEMIASLKDRYGCKTSIVNHIQSLPLQRFIGNDYKSYMEKVDNWGFRSLSIKKDFEAKFGTVSNSFICPSGVPLSSIIERSKTFKGVITKYVYVGSLIRRKCPVDVLKGLAKLKSKSTLNLTYVGEGAERSVIDSTLMDIKENVNVHLVGNVSRTKVFSFLDDAECFIMISKGETFGLVYLEAMARGLITIASRGEGMEGIIIDGHNGFLCNAGDSDELARVLDRVNNLSVEEKAMVSKNAITTAVEYSDKNVALNYFNAIA